MVVLVVLAHGNSDGDILGVDKKPITVQELVNAFCVEQLHGIPKVMDFFSDEYQGINQDQNTNLSQR